MSEKMERCPMCPNHCEVKMIRCIRGRQWQMRQRARMANSQVQQSAEKTDKTEQQNTK